MASPAKKRATSKTKGTTDKNIRDYSNDPFFVKKEKRLKSSLKGPVCRNRLVNIKVNSLQEGSNFRTRQRLSVRKH